MPSGVVTQSEVDVLIIGAGPAGLMACNALARSGLNVRIVDQRPFKVTAGQADGVQPRTMEVLQSYDLAERVLKEANQMHVAAVYNPNPQTGGIELTDQCPAISESVTPYPFEATLHQGAMEEIFLDSMRDMGVEVSRPVVPFSIQISKEEKHSALLHSVRVDLQHLNAVEGQADTETVYAKFVIGADGAHSWVRKFCGIAMEGEQTDHIWGVVDMIPDTDFPDIRNRCLIHSNYGSCMVIPREGDVVRLDIQLEDGVVLDARGRIKANTAGPDEIIDKARRILSPYTLTTRHPFHWWSIYAVGQRVASKYSVDNRIFIVGDACHTHSPKGGQGMNAGINDSHNLAWKLVHVIRGWAGDSLLATYELERRKYAQDLINLDKEFIKLVSEEHRPQDHIEGISRGESSMLLTTFGGFTSGIGVHYSPSTIVDPVRQLYAKNLIVGKRVPPQILIRAADSRPFELQELLPSDSRFKVLIFAGDTSLPSQRAKLGALAVEMNAADGFLKSLSPYGTISNAFDIIAIAAKNMIVRYTDVPELFRSHWSKVFVDQKEVRGNRGGDAYASFGIGPAGVIVIVRPDGYVGTVAPFDQVRDIDRYFAAFTRPRKLSDPV